ncbi:MAG: exosome complex exonuclease Rrp41 [Candidatus Hodarchaeales archaeon]|jgi:exosome complex component RRP41
MSTKDKTKLIDKKGLRLDGRKANELRPIKLKVGVIDRADGSAYIEHGNNKILVAVYGPREIHPKHLSLPHKANVRCEYRLATFSVQERKSPAPRRREHELSKIIAEAMEGAIFTERYPRVAIDIYIQVLDADGGTRCASITAASLAIADVGLPLSGMISAVAVGKVDGKIVLDLSDIEDKEGEGDLPVAINNQDGSISLLQLDGDFTVEEFDQALDMAMEGCREIYKMQKQVLLEKYENIRLAIKAEEAEEVKEAEEDEEMIEPEGLRIEDEGEIEEKDNDEEIEDVEGEIDENFLDNGD